MKNYANVFYAALAVLAIGCSQAKEIGKSTGALFTGTVYDTISATPQQVQAAIDATIADLKYIEIQAATKPSSIENKVQTVVVARDTQDNRIVFFYSSTSPSTTSIGVSTGPFGSSDIRDQAWATLRSHLGLLPSANPAVASPTSEPSSTTPPAAEAPAPEPAASPTASPPPANEPANPLAPAAPSTQPVPPPPAMQM